MARSILGTAELHLKVVSGAFTSGIENARKGADRLKDKFKQLRAEANTVAGAMRALAAVAGAGYLAKRIFDLGAAVEETASKFATVFGPEAERVQEQLAGIATLAGQSQREMMDMVATTGALAQGMGFTQSASADLSEAVQMMAADFASFNNLPVAQTAQTVQRALVGEYESLKLLGVSITAADVAQRALIDSGKTNAREITNQEKVAARLALVYERMGPALDDQATTADSSAARMRILEASIKDTADELAAGMLPALDWVLQRLLSSATAVGELGAVWAVTAAQIAVAREKMKGFFSWKGKMARPSSTDMDDDEYASAVTRAEASLERLQLVYSNFVAGLETGLPPLTTLEERLRRVAEEADGGEGGGGGAAVAFDNLAKKSFDLDFTSNQLIQTIDGEVMVFENLAAAVARSANETDRLREAQSKLSALGSALGFVGRFINPLAGIASAFGTVASGLGIARGIGESFGSSDSNQTGFSQKGGGEVTLNLKIEGPSDRTVNSIRGRIRDFDNLNVPLPV